ncbi:MAG: DUF3224 domain-containing protein [Anaerolineaceae bacterium]|nr:DUF3224 domain-containing protein [Anaerolineaceae bacterium]
MHASVTFRILGRDEEAFDEPEDGPTLTRAQIRKSFEGDLVATGVLMYAMTYLDDENASFLGFEKVVGTLGGRTGSFVLRHTGVYDGEQARASCEVVPGSGTGELAGLSGSGGFAAGHAEQHDMTLEHEI